MRNIQDGEKFNTEGMEKKNEKNRGGETLRAQSLWLSRQKGEHGIFGRIFRRLIQLARNNSMLTTSEITI